MELAKDRVLEVRLECLNYLENCLKNLSFDEEEKKLRD
jgi:hypothetical protein